jgi:phosphoribosylglycinamide formyltransferase-1
MEKLKIGVLGSGKGSNYRAIQEEIVRGKLNAETCVVISDVEGAGILVAARGYGVRAEYVEPGKFKTKLEPEAEARVVELLCSAGVELVVLAGYMRMVKAPLLEAFPGRIINIHPSLLPAYPGLEAWKQALAAGAKETGCTVHFVDSGMDTGPVIAQRTVPVLAGDTAERLHARIQEAEHEVYPEVVRGFAEGKFGEAEIVKARSGK